MSQTVKKSFLLCLVSGASAPWALATPDNGSLDGGDPLGLAILVVLAVLVIVLGGYLGWYYREKITSWLNALKNKLFEKRKSTPRFNGEEDIAGFEENGTESPTAGGREPEELPFADFIQTLSLEDSDREELSRRFSSVENQLNTEKGRLSRKTTDYETLKKEKEKLDVAKKELESEKRTLEKEIEARGNKVIELKGEIAAKDSSIQEKTLEIENLKGAARQAAEDHQNEIDALRREKDAADEDHREKMARLEEAKNAELTVLQSEKDKMQAVYEKIFSDRLWVNAAGGDAELEPVFQNWVNALKNAETVSPPVKGMLSQLFVWRYAVDDKDPVLQSNALEGFSRYFFKWCQEQKYPAENARNLAQKFAAVLNEKVLPAFGVSANKIFVPELSVPYDSKKMFPSSRGAERGQVSSIETWGILDDAGKTKKRATVVLR